MQCPKCHHENSDRVVFCARCHAPLRYICPACKHSQDHGGTCDACGVDFAKYAAMLVFKAESDARLAHEQSRSKSGAFKQILLLPITGGFSLIKYLLGRMKGE
ncbi:MAG: zinc ribbon domain-containing protein [Terriglobia bacterium]